MASFLGLDWAAWIQALSGVAAFLLAPASAQLLWTRFRYRFQAVLIPAMSQPNGRSNSWLITIINKTNTMRPFNAIIYPERSGNSILYADVVTVNDGGMVLTSAILDNGSLSIDIARIAPGRLLSATVSFLEADTPKLHTPSANISSKIKLTANSFTSSRSLYLAIGQQRLMVLLIYFILATVILVVRLLYMAAL